MFLHRIHLDLRCKEVRRDLADPYQMHSTLCRAFVGPNENARGAFMWRLEPEGDRRGNPRLILQSPNGADWSRIGIQDYFYGDPDAPLEHFVKLKLGDLKGGERFRFRLRANPCVTKNGKRLGLFKFDEQLEWLDRKSLLHGFEVKGASVSDEKMLSGRRRDSSQPVRIFSVLFDGALKVVDPEKFRLAVAGGIGHGKAFGLGLLSTVPMRG